MTASPELMGAVEREARELGVWMVRGDEWHAGGWSVATPESIADFAGCRISPGLVGIAEPREQGKHEVEPLTAGLWLLLHAAGLTVERTICKGDGFERAPVAVERVLLEARPTMVEPCCTGPFIECGCEGRVQEDWGGVREARDDLDVLSHRLFDLGDPLGHVLALWLRGELREEHVLGVETLEGEGLSAMLNSTVHIGESTAKFGAFEVSGPAALLGWTMTACHAVAGVWQPVGLAYRPVLEARPA